MLRERGGYNPYCYLPPFSAAALSAWLTHLLNIQIVNIQIEVDAHAILADFYEVYINTRQRIMMRWRVLNLQHLAMRYGTYFWPVLLE